MGSNDTELVTLRDLARVEVPQLDAEFPGTAWAPGPRVHHSLGAIVAREAYLLGDRCRCGRQEDIDWSTFPRRPCTYDTPGLDTAGFPVPVDLVLDPNEDEQEPAT